ncbi:ADP-ribosyltransferase [Clostridium botulinum]|uniref:ADP-ribosyltransferase n=2 Tax=Clostridium TaxID=1485 RepID=UPI001C9AE07B|nr:ADP-ribosyltransferase [Clostridium botulinum]MBY6915747.1 hypothetical protein [Clostridium botulinum]
MGYRKFAEDNVASWIKRYKKESEKFPNYIKKVISHYCKEDQPQINKYLREGKELNEKQLKYLESLDKALSNKIGEKLIVYRNLKENPFINKLTFTEKGYMSTSLLDGSISAIHNGKYMLKILLPSSCQGFYIDFISQRTGEYELLLKRNTKLKKIAYINQKDRILILCKAECN